jgi:iron-regulated transporter 1
VPILLLIVVYPVFQRGVVAASCVIFYVLLKGFPAGSSVGLGLLVVATLFACIEKLCSIMNLVSVEKDWVACSFAPLYGSGLGLTLA